MSAADLFAPLAQRPTLRPYQQKGVDEILACVQRGLNPLYCLPTAGGKGPIIGAVTEVIEQQPDYEVWIFAHREELVNQLSEHLENVGVEHGIIASWAPLTNHRTMVCSVDTVRSRIDQLRHRFPRVRCVVIDECFVAGTLIDGRPIETITVGDSVLSFDERTGEIVSRRVTETSVRAASCVVKIELAGGGSVTCTPNHPFFTQAGWVNAGSLTEGSLVFVGGLLGVRRQSYLPQPRSMANLQEKGPSVLLAGLRQQVPFAREFGEDGADESCPRVDAHAAEQSDASGCVAGKNEGDVAGHRPSAIGARRQRQGDDGTAGDVSGGVGRRMDGGVCRPDGSQERKRDGVLLQDRYSAAGLEDRDRSGRSWSQRQEEGSGQEEGRFLDLRRVVSIEVHERGRSEQFDDLCPGGVVFNFGVEGTHTYFANGVAVHNCHHATTNTYEAIAALCTAAQFIGTTATPFRHDGKPLGTRFDAEVRGPSIRQLEAAEFISPIRLMAPPTKLNLTRIKKRMGDFVLAQLAAAVNTDEITQAAIYAYALHAGGLPTLAFCVDVQHAVDAAHAFKAAGWSVEVMESTFKNCLDAQPGENKRQARRRCIRGLASGRYQILFTIGMAGEGVDVPVCGAGLDLRPTESTQLWLQHLGRIKRLYAGKSEGIWLDLVGNWSKHGMPNADRPWSLAGGLKGMEKAVNAVRRCGNCHYVSERGPERCAVCNRKYPAPRALPPGQAPISDARLASLPGLNGLSPEQVRMTPLKALLPLARTYEDLVTIQRIKNYKASWLTYVAAEKGLRPKTFGSAVPAPRRRGRW